MEGIRPMREGVMRRKRIVWRIREGVMRWVRECVVRLMRKRIMRERIMRKAVMRESVMRQRIMRKGITPGKSRFLCIKLFNHRIVFPAGCCRYNKSACRQEQKMKFVHKLKYGLITLI